MNRLFLLRHARAGWALPGVRDFDRTLDEIGVADAQAIGAVMAREGYVPDVTLCSNALRARETLEGVAGQTDVGRVLFFDQLYTEDATGYLALIKDHGSLGSLLLIGHNPMMEDVAMALAGRGEHEAREALAGGFPTSGLAVLHFEHGLDEIEPGKGYLEAFLTPGS